LEQVMTSLQVFYEGHVQGVGFRFTVRHIAKGFDVTGWVRNLPDGRVEAVFEGDAEGVERLVRWVHTGPGHARVSGVVVADEPVEGLTRFTIV